MTSSSTLFDHSLSPSDLMTDSSANPAIQSLATPTTSEPVTLHTLAIGIEFLGSNYRGWQRQKEVVGVQAVLEDAISKVANETVEVVAAGRTDAGVHASNMIAHFTTQAYRPVRNWLRGINSLLPDDIALRWLTPMPSDFHARFGAIARRYRYVTLNQELRPAILNHQVTHIYEPLDLASMQEAAQFIEGTHDFSSFRAAACQSNQPVRHVSHARLFAHGAFIVFDIQADGFLHHMVRNLMGTLFAIGKGELAPDDFNVIMAKKDRTIAPPTASGDGLYFINAYYRPEFQQLLPHLPLTPIWLNLPD
ncbi:tRNA pseudouridine(38-40) synthase TruA [Psychrobacter pygoscelis]|uniref:tRNA pseudouridine(38-40) synthase TruA n=1 Tax=Psychrobacter pygoscelis TaxID=2488563 RepID=UPI001A9557B1|nr:tRNA pseudouridine(38-40) synthase TruA [Psychrobacter pygoscelis]